MIGCNKEDVCIDNACKCYIEWNKTPSKSILNACFIHLNRNIKTINPKLIISLGASAFYALTGRQDFTWCKGKLIYSKKIKRNVYVINHPAALLYKPSLKDEIERRNLIKPITFTPDLGEWKIYKQIGRKN